MGNEQKPAISFEAAERESQRDFMLYTDPLVQQLAYGDPGLQYRLDAVKQAHKEALEGTIFPIQAYEVVDALQQECDRKFLYPYDENKILRDKAKDDLVLGAFLGNFSERRLTYFMMQDDPQARELYEEAAAAVRFHLEAQALIQPSGAAIPARRKRKARP